MGNPFSAFDADQLIIPEDNSKQVPDYDIASTLMRNRITPYLRKWREIIKEKDTDGIYILPFDVLSNNLFESSLFRHIARSSIPNESEIWNYLVDLEKSRLSGYLALFDNGGTVILAINRESSGGVENIIKMPLEQNNEISIGLHKWAAENGLDLSIPQQ